MAVSFCSDIAAQHSANPSPQASNNFYFRNYKITIDEFT
jgi:hypothetical protein